VSKKWVAVQLTMAIHTAVRSAIHADPDLLGDSISLLTLPSYILSRCSHYTFLSKTEQPCLVSNAN